MRPIELREAFAREGIDVARYFGFATVRNPWQRVVSLFQMTQRNFRLWLNDGDFERWLTSIDPENPLKPPTDSKWYDHGLLNYHSFLRDSQLLQPEVRTYRVEDQLQLMLADLSACCGIDLSASVPHINRSASNASYQSYYNDRTRALVEMHYKGDIAAYGYCFEGILAAVSESACSPAT